MAKGKHPVPFRTRKLSPSAPMVLRGGLRGRVGRRRTSFAEGRYRAGSGPRCLLCCACCAVQQWACCAVCLAAGPCRQAGQDRQPRNSRSLCRLGIVWPCIREPAWLTGRDGAAEARGLVLAGEARSWLARLTGSALAMPGTRVVRTLVWPVRSRSGPAGSWWIS
jgi:hypothetical protein